METFFIILASVVAGAGFGVLIALLIGAERELKSKNQRLMEMESGPGSDSETKLSDQEGARLREIEQRDAELTEKSTQLQTELAELKREIEANQEKPRRLENLQTQLAETERQSVELSNKKTQLQTELAELKREIEANQENPRRLENLQTQLAETERQRAELREKSAQEAVILEQSLSEFTKVDGKATSTPTTQTLGTPEVTEPTHAGSDADTERQKRADKISFGILTFALAGALSTLSCAVSPVGTDVETKPRPATAITDETLERTLKQQQGEIDANKAKLERQRQEIERLRARLKAY
ncbi:MAG: hypothetical protein ACREQA_15055 [Candidatus Binatia bacterium]